MTGPTHPLVQAIDRIAQLPLSPAKKLLLVCLARHADWDSLSSARPGMRVLQGWTGLSRRRVQRLLDEMTCRTPRPLRAQLNLGEVTVYEPCGRCQKVDDRGRQIPGDDLLLVGRPAVGRDAPSYLLFLEERVEQLALPEVGRFRGASASSPSREQPERLATA